MHAEVKRGKCTGKATRRATSEPDAQDGPFRVEMTCGGLFACAISYRGWYVLDLNPGTVRNEQCAWIIVKMLNRAVAAQDNPMEWWVKQQEAQS